MASFNHPFNWWTEETHEKLFVTSLFIFSNSYICGDIHQKSSSIRVDVSEDGTRLNVSRSVTATRKRVMKGKKTCFRSMGMKIRYKIDR